MRTVTATELARNLSRILDEVARDGGEIVIERNGRPVARLLAAPRGMTALEMFGDLYGVLTPEEGARWEADSEPARGETLDKALRDPWES